MLDATIQFYEAIFTCSGQDVAWEIVARLNSRISRLRVMTLSTANRTVSGPARLREIFEVQMQEEYFPVQLDHMGADFDFLAIERASEHVIDINGIPTKVTALRENHPGGAYAFRIECKGKALVICTDVEHEETMDPHLIELARGADLLVHDAQFTAEELATRRGWGIWPGRVSPCGGGTRRRARGRGGLGRGV